MIVLAHNQSIDVQNNVAKRPRLIRDNSPRFSSPVIMQRGRSRTPKNHRITTTYNQLDGPCMSGLADDIPGRDVSQCRLRRIQSKDRANVAEVFRETTFARTRAHVPLPFVSNTELHPSNLTRSDSAFSPDSDSDSDGSILLPISDIDSDVTTDSDTDLDTDTDTIPRYPFPPPGLSKPTSQTMIMTELETNACTPQEVELNSRCEGATVQDSSIWNSFQMESFLGNYCSSSGTGGAGRVLLPPFVPTSGEDGPEFELLSSPLSSNAPKWNVQETVKRNTQQAVVTSDLDPFSSDDSDYDYYDYDLEYGSSQEPEIESLQHHSLLQPSQPASPASVHLSSFSSSHRQYRSYSYPEGPTLSSSSSSSSSTSSTTTSSVSDPPALASVPSFDYPLAFPTPRYPVPGQNLIDPQLLLRQRQKAYVTGWSQLRERRRRIGVGPAPIMPSLMNPVRTAAPIGSWSMLREVLCGDDDIVKNTSPMWRRGRQSMYEKALIETAERSRTVCDRVRKVHQDAFGLRWGLHAWLGPTKHCRYCASDGLLKGLLAHRAYDGERIRRMMQESEMMALSTLDVDGQPEEKEEGMVFLSYPYINQAPTQYADAGVAPENVGDIVDHAENTDSWSEELQNELLQSPQLKDLDEFEEDEDGDDGYYEDEYGDEYDESSSESSESNEEDEVENKDTGDKDKEKLTSFWEDDDDDRWKGEKIEVKGLENVQDVQVAEVQVEV